MEEIIQWIMITILSLLALNNLHIHDKMFEWLLEIIKKDKK